MGNVGRVTRGVLTIVGGVAIGVFTQNWSLAVTIAAAGVGVLTAPRFNPGDLANRTGRVLENRTGSVQRVPVVYGTAKVGAMFADIRVDPASRRRRRLVLVPVWCHGSRSGDGITAIDKLWLDGRLAVDGAVVQDPFDGTVSGESSTAYLDYEHHLGSATQTADARLTDLFPTEWPAESEGRGVCYSRLELWFDAEVYPGGLPTVTALIRGNEVHDPRDDTWKHSDNPALCIRDYLLSPVYGFGIPAANIDDQSFIEAANYCDEIVSTFASGFQKRYTLNGWVDTSREVEQNLAEMCSSCRAQVVNEGNVWRIVIRRARVGTAFHITEENTVEGSWQFVLPGADALPNVVRASFVDPTREYEVDVVQWPEAGQPNAYLTADNDYEHRLEMDLPFTQDRIMAQQLAMTTLKESRSGLSVVVTLQESALQVRVGDLVRVTHGTPGWSGKWFDVAALLLMKDARVQAVLAEYEETAYDLDPQVEQPTAPDTDLPNPFSVPAPTSLVLTSLDQALQTNDGRYVPRIRAVWTAADDPFVTHFEVQAKRATDTEWDTFGQVGVNQDHLLYIYPVTDEEWDVRVRAVNNLGVASAWLEGAHIVSTPDPRPQILSITMAQAHADLHTDEYSDVAHSDTAHVDAHSDDAHLDTHLDKHGDVTPHSDFHEDIHGDGDLHGDFHEDASGTHSDSHTDDHIDSAHADTHTDTGHADTVHSDGHLDAHGDGTHGIGVALQADSDAASIRVVARKHGDVAHADHTDGAHTDTAHTDVTNPTEAEVRDQPSHDGRNVVVELLDVATGAQVTLEPGDQVRIGAIAYSETGGAGVEGPLAIGTANLFSVAPVGTDKWVPT